MDLQITVFLLFILFTAATKGQYQFCYQCVGLDSCEEKVDICPIETSCESTTKVMKFGYFKPRLIVKQCILNCVNMSINVGVWNSVSTCCDTFLCNYKNAPDPKSLVSNGRKCYYCDWKSCSNIVSCSGGEDRCLTATGMGADLPAVVKGCVTKSFCNTTCSCMKDISCCEGDLCNSEDRVIKNLMYDADVSVTQSIIKSVTQSFKYNKAQSDVQSFKYSKAQSDVKSFNKAQSDVQSFKYNRAQSVIYCFLFLCCSLLYFILMT